MRNNTQVNDNRIAASDENVSSSQTQGENKQIFAAFTFFFSRKHIQNCEQGHDTSTNVRGINGFITHKNVLEKEKCTGDFKSKIT